VKLSRKEFLKKGLFSFGEMLGMAAGVLETLESAEPLFRGESDSGRAAGTGSHAVAHNERCLAEKCGCFVCVERCEARAITVVIGEGIKIDSTACTGCGTCTHFCPVFPKAVTMSPGNR
jgi:Pyruvate/2-oxoacid:ferredoxin oxidoreductase delta subunit